MFDSEKTTEVLIVMTVFLEIAGRDQPFEFSLNMKTTSALYEKTIQGKPLQYNSTILTAKEAAHVFGSARTTEALTVLTVFLEIAGRDRSIEFFFSMKTTSALYQKTIQGKPLQCLHHAHCNRGRARVWQRTDNRGAHCYDGFTRNRR